METFYGDGHIPGGTESERVEMDIDWDRKQIEVRLPQTKGAITAWPGLLVQTFGKDEAAFRTKGIPPLDVNWWHVIRYSEKELWVMVLGLPNKEGVWPNCSFGLKRL